MPAGLQISQLSRLCPHGHGALSREDWGRGRRQLDRSGAAVRQRDTVDPLPAGGVCGQRVGVLQRGDRAHIHAVFPAVHFTVSSNHRDVFQPDIKMPLCKMHMCLCDVGRSMKPIAMERWRRPCPLASSSSSSVETWPALQGATSPTSCPFRWTRMIRLISCCCWFSLCSLHRHLNSSVWQVFVFSLCQVVTVVFYIFTDLILISQFLYYKIKNGSNRSKPWSFCIAAYYRCICSGVDCVDNKITALLGKCLLII